MPSYSSRQAARKLGLLPTTLSNYIVAKKIPAPKSIKTGDITVYLWTDEDIEKVRKLLPKIANGRKTRYQKKQSAISNQSTARRDLRQSAKTKAKAKKKAQARAPVLHSKKK